MYTQKDFAFVLSGKLRKVTKSLTVVAELETEHYQCQLDVDAAAQNHASVGLPQ